MLQRRHAIPVLHRGLEWAGTLWLHLLMLMLAVVGYSGTGSLLLVALRRRLLLLLISLISVKLRLLISLIHLLILRVLLLGVIAALVGRRWRHGHATKVLLVAHAGQLFDLDAGLNSLLLDLLERVVISSLPVLPLFFF